MKAATATVEEVTPQRATELLRTMRKNRPLSQNRVIDYAIQMEGRRWSLNGESLKFDAEGHLFDGQHRLQACILAETPFRTYVIRGLEDPNAFATIDIHSVRTHADIFGIEGWQSNKTAAQAAMLLYLFNRDMISWNGPVRSSSRQQRRRSKLAAKVAVMPSSSQIVSRTTLAEYARTIRVELEQAVRFSNGLKAKRIMPVGMLAALYFLFRQKDPVAAEAFCHDLGEGTGLQKNDPVFTLRERILTIRASNTRLLRWTLFGFAIKAWNRRREHKPLAAIRVSAGEAFPKII